MVWNRIKNRTEQKAAFVNNLFICLLMYFVFLVVFFPQRVALGVMCNSIHPAEIYSTEIYSVY